MPQTLDLNAQHALEIKEQEHFLLKKIASLQELLESIQEHHQTHLLTHYAIELATAFHNYYAQTRIVNPENIKETQARLLMMMVLKNTFATVLDMLGISKPEKM